MRRVAVCSAHRRGLGLPAYELALMTSAWLASAEPPRRGASRLVTPEDEPLKIFGREASAAVRELLDEREIAVHTRAYPAEAGRRAPARGRRNRRR